jgi:hypothetical protein
VPRFVLLSGNTRYPDRKLFILSFRIDYDNASYRNWYKYAYRARNGIIHLGTRGTSADDAGKAFNAVVTFMKFIKQVLK